MPDKYRVETATDGEGRITHYFVAGGRPPVDNEFRDKTSAEEWITKVHRRAKANARARGRADALRSVGMVKTKYGWE